MFSIENNVWAELENMPLKTMSTAAGLYLDEIWVACEAWYKVSAFSIVTQTHRFVNIELDSRGRPYRFFINVRESLYIFTNGADIRKVTNRDGEHSMIASNYFKGWKTFPSF